MCGNTLYQDIRCFNVLTISILQFFVLLPYRARHAAVPQMSCMTPPDISTLAHFLETFHGQNTTILLMDQSRYRVIHASARQMCCMTLPNPRTMMSLSISAPAPHTHTPHPRIGILHNCHFTNKII